MSDRIRYTVYPRKNGNYTVEWRDPVTGERQFKTTGEKKEGPARVAAAKIIARVESGVTADRKKTWDDFSAEFKMLRMSSKRPKTKAKMNSTLTAVKELINPKCIGLFDNPLLVARFAQKLREKRVVEATVKSHLSCLRTILNWAKDVGYINQVPFIDMPPSNMTDKRKGRDPTREEFDRFLMKIPDVIELKYKDPHRSRRFRELAIGFWLSTLRLNEGCNLHWTDPDLPRVDFSKQFPVVIIPAKFDKKTVDREIAMTPDLAVWLLSTFPPEARHGFVFKVENHDGTRPSAEWIGKLGSRIGAKAGIKVADRLSRKYQRDPETGKPIKTLPKVVTETFKFASFHDFRRSCAVRMANAGVTEEILMEMMRHKDAKTLNVFYLGAKAQKVAKSVREQFSDTFTDTAPFPDPEHSGEAPQTIDAT